MSVVITKTPAFWAPGFLVLPDQVDKPLVFKFKLRFKRLPTEENKALIDLLDKNRMLAPGAPLLIDDAGLLDKVLVDWDGFPDEDGKPVPYTPANRAEAVADWAGLEAAMVRCYLDHAWPAQRDKEAAKNSGAPSATT